MAVTPSAITDHLVDEQVGDSEQHSPGEQEQHAVQQGEAQARRRPGRVQPRGGRETGKQAGHYDPQIR
jgi:hypothetical protein